MLTIQIGTWVLNGFLLYVLAYGAGGWLALRYGFPQDQGGSKFADAASAAFWIGLAVWKLTPILFDGWGALRDPLSLLLLDGGTNGQLLAAVAVVVYMTRRANREGWKLAMLTESAIVYIAGGTILAEAVQATIRFSNGESPALSLFAIACAAGFAVLYRFSRPTALAVSAGAVLPLALAALAIGREHRLLFAFSLSVMQIVYLGIAWLAVRERGLPRKLSAFALAIAIVGFGIYSTAGNRIDDSREAGAQITVGIRKGQVAPDFELTDLQGTPVRLSDFRGHKVLVNFWASWCPPCRAEMPHIQKFYEKYKDRGVAVLSVNLASLEKNDEMAASFARKHGLAFPIVLDSDGGVLSTFKVKAYPTTFVVDENGVVQHIVVGPMTLDYMKTLI